MKRIGIITNKYPNPIEPNVLVFVQQLVWEMADQGIECFVICPVPINLRWRLIYLPKEIKEITENGNSVRVFFPKYIGFGDSHCLFGKSPAQITTYFFTRAVSRVVRRLKNRIEVIYGHFIEPAGIATARIGRKYQIPAFVAYGEATKETINLYGVEKVRKELSSLQGIISVSTQNKRVLQELDILQPYKIGVFPNGYRKERFFKRNKKKARHRFGLPEKAFIIGFVGSFDERKGINRVMQALDDIEDIYIICAGGGKLKPLSNKCLYSDVVNNEDLPYFYSAMDLFVLPTLAEGCCNAVIEAMACGCPIISSNLSFNADILDDTCSIRVDPMNRGELTEAIRQLKQNDFLRQRLAKGSLKKAKALTLSARTKGIIDFISLHKK